MRFLFKYTLSSYGMRAGMRKLGCLIVAAMLGVWLWQGAAARADTLRIAVLGDSLTQGYGLAQGDGFVPQMQAWLDRRGAHVRLINAGVSGDTTAGGLSRIGWTLAGGLDGLIVALGGNDVLRGIDPAESRRNLEGILQAAAGTPVLLVGIEAPGNLGPDYVRAFAAIFPDLAAKYGTGLYPDFVKAITERKTMVGLVQADGIHPNAAGVKLIVSDMGPSVLALAKSLK